MPMPMCPLRDFHLSANIVSVVVVVVAVVLVTMLPMLGVSISSTHVVSLEPRLHLDKANFSPTALGDKGN
jgi:hypothetical protein